VTLRRAAFAPSAIALGFLTIALSSAWLDDYKLEVGFRGLLLVSLAEAWNLLAGYGGLVSLGSASFIGVGAYALVGLLNANRTGVALALICAGFCAAIVAFVVAPAVFRLRGLYFTVGTLALAEALRLFMVNYNGFGGASGLILATDPPGLRSLFLIALALFAFTTLVMTLATGTRFSILLRAVRDDEDAAAQIGIRPYPIKLAAFVVAGLVMGVAGGLQALKLGAIEPYGMFGLQWTVNVLAIVIIGGQGRRLGPLLGTIFIVVLGEVLGDYPVVQLAFTGMLLVAVIRFAPNGLAGILDRFIERVRPPRTA
jgi:branched-chain amino acid transport system permease protein